jgi:aminodeoxyfutalosine deaminase
MDSIDAWNRRGYDVFVGQGASHYTIQKELLQQRYGEPLTYRPGQMSGNLLIDGPNITPDDIRQGVAVTEERVARAENPIDKALLSEELRALQYELAQRL